MSDNPADNKPIGPTGTEGANTVDGEKDWSGLFSSCFSDASAPEPMKKFAAMFGDFASSCSTKFSDMKKRFSAIDAEKQEQKKDKESTEMAAFSADCDNFYRSNNNSQKITPSHWEAEKKAEKDMLFGKMFADAATARAQIKERRDAIERLPINPAFQRGGSTPPPDFRPTSTLEEQHVVELRKTPGGQQLLRVLQTAGK